MQGFRSCGFTALALVLAAIGTHGVLSYTVIERRREIGIRLAVAAARSHVLTRIVRQGLDVANRRRGWTAPPRSVSSRART